MLDAVSAVKFTIGERVGLQIDCVFWLTTKKCRRMFCVMRSGRRRSSGGMSNGADQYRVARTNRNKCLVPFLAQGPHTLRLPVKQIRFYLFKWMVRLLFYLLALWPENFDWWAILIRHLKWFDVVSSISVGRPTLLNCSRTWCLVLGYVFRSCFLPHITLYFAVAI